MAIVFSDRGRRYVHLYLPELESVALVGTSLLAAFRPQELTQWITDAGKLAQFLATGGCVIVQVCRADGGKLPGTAWRLPLHRSPEPYRGRVRHALLLLCGFGGTKRFPEIVELLS